MLSFKPRQSASKAHILNHYTYCLPMNPTAPLDKGVGKVLGVLTDIILHSSDKFKNSDRIYIFKCFPRLY